MGEQVSGLKNGDSRTFAPPYPVAIEYACYPHTSKSSPLSRSCMSTVQLALDLYARFSSRALRLEPLSVERAASFNSWKERTYLRVPYRSPVETDVSWEGSRGGEEQSNLGLTRNDYLSY